jgi:hypothetical protein
MRRSFAIVIVVVMALACGPSKVETLVELSKENDCSVDDDCCIVEEPCTARAFLVTADEFADAKATAEFDEGGVCADCSAPATTVACVDGRCQGTSFSPNVSLAPEQPASSCGAREVRLEDDGLDPAGVTFEQFFGCDELNK